MLAMFLVATADVSGQDVLMNSAETINPGNLTLAFDSAKNSGGHYPLAHVVPGFEYRIGSDFDFLGEIGIGLAFNLFR